MQQTTFQSLSEEILTLSCLKENSIEGLLGSAASSPLLTDFTQKINYHFKDPDLLIEALTHTSFTHEFSGAKSYQNLEFLGDAVLDLLVSQLLLIKYPEFNEGQLSRFRGSLVNEKSLSDLACSLELGALLILGRGEFKGGGHKKDSLLADSVESILGAVFQDGGLAAAEMVFKRFMQLFHQVTGKEFISEEQLTDFDSKSRLQEKSMALFKVRPAYNFTSLEDGSFEVEVTILEHSLGRANGTSKKKAESNIANTVLNKKLYMNIPGAKIC
ncbi:MAG: ribonuclease III [Halobacteriovoraceae bacterium]|jgi:ribonuclease III|nr:ribonuclease III [Halobacteriovoraceae bacterium]